VTIPKSLADQYGIRPGDELNWVPAGETIRVAPARPAAHELDLETRLRLFDKATKRQRERARKLSNDGRLNTNEPVNRGWKREDLYTRDGSH
jgi:bifunctional DNA-binding transcriptional regulator/antitoxin component of YhaV-PrlF toxin-antitoxin module